MAKKIISTRPESGKGRKIPLLSRGQDIEDLPETDIPMAQVFLLGSLVMAHTLNGYPLERILNRFTVEDIATAYRRFWRWSIMMSVPGQEPAEEDSYKF